MDFSVSFMLLSFLFFIHHHASKTCWWRSYTPLFSTRPRRGFVHHCTKRGFPHHNDLGEDSDVRKTGYPWSMVRWVNKSLCPGMMMNKSLCPVRSETKNLHKTQNYVIPSPTSTPTRTQNIDHCVSSQKFGSQVFSYYLSVRKTTARHLYLQGGTLTVMFGLVTRGTLVHFCCTILYLLFTPLPNLDFGPYYMEKENKWRDRVS